MWWARAVVLHSRCRANRTNVSLGFCAIEGAAYPFSLTITLCDARVRERPPKPIWHFPRFVLEWRQWSSMCSRTQVSFSRCICRTAHRNVRRGFPASSWCATPLLDDHTGSPPHERRFCLCRTTADDRPLTAVDLLRFAVCRRWSAVTCLLVFSLEMIP